MAPNYVTSTRLGFRFPSDVGSPNVISDFSTLMTTMAGDLDAKLLGYLEGTHAARPAAGISNRIYRETDTASYWFDNGTSWVQLAGPRVTNRPHSWTLDDASSINPSASKVASFPIYPAAGESVALIGALVLCDSTGATASTFKLQTDHASHGTYADVTVSGGGVTLTPATGSYVFVAAASPLTMASGDGVRIVATNAGVGTSKGLEVAPVTQHVS